MNQPIDRGYKVNKSYKKFQLKKEIRSLKKMGTTKTINFFLPAPKTHYVLKLVFHKNLKMN